MSKPYQTSAATLPEGMRVKAPTVDLAGQKYGRLTPLKVVGRHTNKSLLWLCKCDCGAEVTRSSASLRKRPDASGISCGCYLKEISRERLANMPRWNVGKTYANKAPGAVYAHKHSWGTAVRRVNGSSCELCGWDKATCDVHHKVSRAEGGLNTVENGIVLCPNCHRVAHESGGAES